MKLGSESCCARNPRACKWTFWIIGLMFGIGCIVLMSNSSSYGSETVKEVTNVYLDGDSATTIIAYACGGVTALFGGLAMWKSHDEWQAAKKSDSKHQAVKGWSFISNLWMFAALLTAVSFAIAGSYCGIFELNADILSNGIMTNLFSALTIPTIIGISSTFGLIILGIVDCKTMQNAEDKFQRPSEFSFKYQPLRYGSVAQDSVRTESLFESNSQASEEPTHEITKGTSEMVESVAEPEVQPVQNEREIVDDKTSESEHSPKPEKPVTSNTDNASKTVEEPNVDESESSEGEDYNNAVDSGDSYFQRNSEILKNRDMEAGIYKATDVETETVSTSTCIPSPEPAKPNVNIAEVQSMPEVVNTEDAAAVGGDDFPPRSSVNKRVSVEAFPGDTIEKLRIDVLPLLNEQMKCLLAKDKCLDEMELGTETYAEKKAMFGDAINKCRLQLEDFQKILDYQKQQSAEPKRRRLAERLNKMMAL